MCDPMFLRLLGTGDLPWPSSDDVAPFVQEYPELPDALTPLQAARDDFGVFLGYLRIRQPDGTLKPYTYGEKRRIMAIRKMMRQAKPRLRHSFQRLETEASDV